jgi:phosphoglycerate dehydrogenase-like enzyme
LRRRSGDFGECDAVGSVSDHRLADREPGVVTPPTNTTLVIVGTGKTGRRVAERLIARGVPVRIGSRPPGRVKPGAVIEP